jgi:hypothetical protein
MIMAPLQPGFLPAHHIKTVSWILSSSSSSSFTSFFSFWSFHVSSPLLLPPSDSVLPCTFPLFTLTSPFHFSSSFCMSVSPLLLAFRNHEDDHEGRREEVENAKVRSSQHSISRRDGCFVTYRTYVFGAHTHGRPSFLEAYYRHYRNIYGSRLGYITEEHSLR